MMEIVFIFLVWGALCGLIGFLASRALKP
jgi:hypothetical protein